MSQELYLILLNYLELHRLYTKEDRNYCYYTVHPCPQLSVRVDLFRLGSNPSGVCVCCPVVLLCS